MLLVPAGHFVRRAVAVALERVRVRVALVPAQRGRLGILRALQQGESATREVEKQDGERDGKLAESYPCPLQVWRLGALTMIAMGGEVVADFSLRFKAKYGWDTTWVAAYANDVFAYIPSVRVLKEGGYEGESSMLPYGLPSKWATGIEEKIIGKVKELSK